MIQHQQRRTILYVDDTVEQRYAMRRILETEGFHVVEAGYGKEALRLIDPAVALAVVDVKLPDMNGYDLSRKIKTLDPHLPILQVSASFSDPDLRAAGFSGGADAYIAQPVHPSEMVAVIRRLLRSSEAEESLRFLAAMGPALSSSLSIEETVRNVQRAMVPHFADRCDVYLEGVGELPASVWTSDSRDADDAREVLENQVRALPAMLDSRRIVAPLITGNRNFGGILFGLGKDREYTVGDLAFATDLSSRAGLALQNCILFASAQSARAALIQSEKLATAGRMSAAIAHEINNPLEALTNLIYIIEQSDDVPPAMRDIATAALAEVSRLAHIARQSLGFYRELRAPSILNLSESVRDTVELYRKRFASGGIEIALHLQDEILINGIKGEIRQVISNLLVNALEATQDGGRIEIESVLDGAWARVSVIDHGAGIEDEISSKIFEPFFTTKQGTGTGLGLWITQSIVEKHGGRLTMKTKRGEDSGTRFVIELPSVSAETA